MSDCDELIIHLMKHYRGKVLNLHSVLKRSFDDVDVEFIQGMIYVYLKVIEDLKSLLPK